MDAVTPFVTVGRGKAAALFHLMQMHGQVEPQSPTLWSLDELEAAHRNGHSSDGVMTVLHHHETQAAAA